MSTRTYRPPRWHRFIEHGIAAVAWFAIAAVVLIVVFIGREAAPILWNDDAHFRLRDLFLPRHWPSYDHAVAIWQPVGTPSKFNVLPLLVGTLKVTSLAMMLSVPFALGAAIYVSQYAHRRVREVLKPMIELLAGIPSVVLGFFALMFIATWLQRLLHLTYRLNALTAAVGLSLAIIPVVFTISEDALSSVPKHLREASYALGARQWQTILKVVLPAALPGVTAAIILGFGRAIGETMIVLMASGNAAVIQLFRAGVGARTITATIASELGEVARGETHWQVLFLLGLLLFLITFTINWFGSAFVKRLHKRLTANS